MDIVDSNLKFVKGPEQRRLLKVEYEIALMKEENPPTERVKYQTSSSRSKKGHNPSIAKLEGRNMLARFSVFVQAGRRQCGGDNPR